MRWNRTIQIIIAKIQLLEVWKVEIRYEARKRVVLEE